jgi:hypothetical protein
MTFLVQAPRLSGGGPAPYITLKLNTGLGEYHALSGLLINPIIQIVSGAVGGNVAAGAAKNIDLGTLGNTIARAIGGGIGGSGDRSLACCIRCSPIALRRGISAASSARSPVVAWRVPFSRRSSARSRTRRLDRSAMAARRRSVPRRTRWRVMRCRSRGAMMALG